MANKLRHIAISVRDPEKAAKFFEEAFGMTRAGSAQRGVYLTDGIFNVALLNFGDEPIAGFEDQPGVQGLIHFGMWVDNVDEIDKKITAAGGKYVTGRKETNPNVFYEVKYATPEGFIFDVTENGWRGAVKDVVPGQGERDGVSAAHFKPRVVIVGAGPVGMVCALALNRRGVPVTVFEQEPAPVTDQRAASLHPTTLEMLDDLGVFEKILPRGLVSTAYRFHDRPSHSVVAEFDLGLLRDEFRFPFVLQYEQYKLTASIAAEYANAGDFDVRFSHSVTGPDANGRWRQVEVETPSGPERVEAAYVIGCDGGRSTVRRLADIAFEGFTYPERFIKIATSFDFGTVNPNLVYRNFFSDPSEWCNLFKVRGERPPGLWRAIFPIGAEESDESALSPERVETRLQKFFAKPGRYPIEYVNVYGVNQRVAATFRKGRVLLAGDAAHANNPIGGTGHERRHPRRHQPRREACQSDPWRRGRRASRCLLRASGGMRRKNLCRRRPSPTSGSWRSATRAVRKANFDDLRRTAENRETARAYMRRAALADSLREAAALA